VVLTRGPPSAFEGTPPRSYDVVALDFFTVPSVRLRVLFVLVVLANHRRRVVLSFAKTASASFGERPRWSDRPQEGEDS
jgi:hypothetical protein